MSHIRQSENKKAVRNTFIICTVIALIILSAAIACFFIFRIKEVSIKGSEKYTEEQLIQASGIGKNSNLIITRASAVERSLRTAYPSLEDIKISKKFPDRLEITVTDSEELYYIELGSDVFTITDDLRVTSQNKPVPEGAIELRSCGIVSVVVGEYMKFDKDTHYNYLKGLLENVRSHKISEHIVRVDMSEKFNIRLKYDDRFIIEIGDAENVNTKLTLAEAYISSLRDDEKGIIYATGLEIGSFRPSNDIE